MPAKPLGVYSDGQGGWYIKVTLGQDQTTADGSKSPAGAFGQRPRRPWPAANLSTRSNGSAQTRARGTTVNELLDLYLDGLDADGRLSAKTRFDYRHTADKYVRPHLGARRVRDITPEILLAWQRKLAREGATKNGQDFPPTPSAWPAPFGRRLQVGHSRRD